MSRRRQTTRAAIGAWALLVLIGSVSVVRRAARLESQRWYVAAYAMRLNHRLAEHDLSTPQLEIPSLSLHLPERKEVVGRYLAQNIHAGEALKPELLRRTPRIEMQSNRVAAFIPVTPPLSSIIDVGTMIDVAGVGTVAQGVCVEAVWCESTSCWAVVQLTPEEAAVMNREEKPVAVPRSVW